MLRTALRAAATVLLPVFFAVAPGFLSPRPAQAEQADDPYAYDAAAPLDWRDSLETTTDGVEVRAFSFASPRGGRATGLVMVPARSGRVPGILLMHGAPGSARQAAPRALNLARKGAVVVALDAPWARTGGSPVTFTEADSLMQVQTVVDMRRAVDALLARADVDGDRLAFVGGSYGGAQGALLAGVEPRIRRFVLSAADGGMVAHFTTADGAPAGPAAELPAEAFARWRSSLERLEASAYAGRVPATTAAFFQHGRVDEIVPPAAARRIHDAFSGTKEVKWYDSGHRMPRVAQVDQMAWLHRTIGIDAPTEAEYRAAAEVDAAAARPAR